MMPSGFLYSIITNHQAAVVVVSLDPEILLVVQILINSRSASLLRCQLTPRAGPAQNSHQHL